jgi:hypothetical protein
MKATPLFTSWKSADFNSSELGAEACRDRGGQKVTSSGHRNGEDNQQPVSEEHWLAV